MFKKIATGAAALTLGVLAVGIGSAPANASETKKEPICHATSSDKNAYNQQLVARDSIINGGHGANGVNVNDIIAPFDYNFDGGAVEHYPGQNWTPENQVLWNNQCNPANTVLTPVVPVAPVATCRNEHPTLTVPVQPNGLNVSSTADDKGNFTVAFELPKNNPYTAYAFPAGFVNPISIKTIDNRQSDPLWDAATGTCKMPDTGAGSIKSEHLVIAGGLIFSGALLVAFAGRRKNA